MQILYAGTKVITDQGLQMRISGMNRDWHAVFAETGREALALMGKVRFDAVVTDSKLKDMDGVNLLNSVQKHYPDTRRVIVSELNDNAEVLKWAGMAVHCVPKPWDSATLRPVLERIFALGIWLSNPTVRQLVGRMTRIPSPPTLYFEVVRALQSAKADLGDVAQLVARDPAITAKLLQLANSASLGLRNKVSTVGEALGYVGLEATRSLILLAHTFSYCDQTRLAGFSIESLWNHSLETGVLARKIARAEAAPIEIIDESFLAGLLHDIGKLLLAVNLPEDYSEVITRARQGGIPLWEAELEKFGATHAELGAELLANWNLPLTVVEALALHHYPSKLMSPSFCPLTAVHVANVIEHGFSAPESSEKSGQIDTNYLSDLGLTDRLDFWRETCRESLEAGSTQG